MGRKSGEWEGRNCLSGEREMRALVVEEKELYGERVT